MTITKLQFFCRSGTILANVSNNDRELNAQSLYDCPYDCTPQKRFVKLKFCPFRAVAIEYFCGHSAPSKVKEEMVKIVIWLANSSMSAANFASTYYKKTYRAMRLEQMNVVR